MLKRFSIGVFEDFGLRYLSSSTVAFFFRKARARVRAGLFRSASGLPWGSGSRTVGRPEARRTTVESPSMPIPTLTPKCLMGCLRRVPAPLL